MAHTGSYAITTSFIISALMPLRPAVSCVSHTLKVSPLSRSSLSSPMQLGEEGKEERGGERRREEEARRQQAAERGLGHALDGSVIMSSHHHLITAGRGRRACAGSEGQRLGDDGRGQGARWRLTGWP